MRCLTKNGKAVSRFADCEGISLRLQGSPFFVAEKNVFLL